MLSLAQHNAKQRLVKFLLDMADKNKQSSEPYPIVNLSMTRGDIANYLGMAIETISRLLSKMHVQGIINVNNRKIMLCNMAELHTTIIT